MQGPRTWYSWVKDLFTINPKKVSAIEGRLKDVRNHTSSQLRPYSLVPSLNSQFCNRKPLCSTFRFENLRSPKKTSLIPQKNFNKIKKKNLTPKTWKKRPQKLLIIGPYFFMYRSSCQKGPKSEIPYHQQPLNAGLVI